MAVVLLIDFIDFLGNKIFHKLFRPFTLNEDISDRVSKFRGTEEDDVEAWIDRLQVLAAVLGAENKNVVRQMPVMLDGAAYEVWAALPASNREEKQKIFGQSRRTFGIPRFEAWRRLKNDHVLTLKNSLL